jgi:hypothetical protein
MKFKFDFDINGDYQEQFSEYVTEILTTTKRQVKERKAHAKIFGERDAAHDYGETLANRALRSQIIEDLTEDYFRSTGQMPEGSQLERLSNVLLEEELADDSAWKSRQSEYAFFSEEQLARRRDGVHQRKNEGGQSEVKIEKAWSIGANGKDYRKPKRRERSDNENIKIDENTKSRNKERLKRYREFTKVQPVITRHISELEGHNVD